MTISVLWLLLMASWVGLHCLIVVFHTQDWIQTVLHSDGILDNPRLLLDFLVTVKAAPYDCVIRTGQP